MHHLCLTCSPVLTLLRLPLLPWVLELQLLPWLLEPNCEPDPLEPCVAAGGREAPDPIE